MSKELIKITEHDGVEYVSATDLELIGYEINPFASLSSLNKPLFNSSGEMIDLLIPKNQIDVHTLNK